MITYQATAERSGDWWALQVPSVRGVHSQVADMADARDVLRDALALALDVPIETVDVTFAM